VLVLESGSAGGQAGTSSRIENYLGFPTGISCMDLTTRAYAQALKFGAEVMIAKGAVKLDCRSPLYGVAIGDDATLVGRAVIIARGAEYRKPSIENLRQFEGAGVYYAATQSLTRGRRRKTHSRRSRAGPARHSHGPVPRRSSVRATAMFAGDLRRTPRHRPAVPRARAREGCSSQGRGASRQELKIASADLEHLFERGGSRIPHDRLRSPTSWLPRHAPIRSNRLRRLASAASTIRCISFSRLSA